MILYRQILIEANPGRREADCLGQRLSFFTTEDSICYKVILLAKKMNSKKKLGNYLNRTYKLFSFRNSSLELYYLLQI